MTNTEMTVEDALEILAKHGINGVTFEKLLKIRADSTPLCTCGNESHSSWCDDDCPSQSWTEVRR